MNKIIIGNEGIIKQTIDENIKIIYKIDDFSLINSLEINFINNADLDIIYQIDNNIKLKVINNFSNNVSINIFEKYTDGTIKINNIYNINSNANINIQKFYDVQLINQADIININGEKSKVNYILKSISKNKDNYNLIVNHNACYTESNIINHAINIKDGEIIFNVDGIIPKRIIGCSLNQNNRIVTFNDKKCQINPNLLIDTNDVIANHSAFVGRFNDNDLFYLQSRGIEYNEAIKLLVTGFLISNLNITEANKNEIIQIINKYWR